MGCADLEGVVGRGECECCGDSSWVSHLSWKQLGNRKLLRENRNADSPTKNKDGELLFVKPWEEQQSFSDFLDFISGQEKSGQVEFEEVRYAQTRESYVVLGF